MQSTWLILYGGKAKFVKFFKNFAENFTNIKSAKGIEENLESAGGELSRLCTEPYVRNSKFGLNLESHRTFSETFMFQLMDFQEYKDFPLDQAEMIVRSSYVHDIPGLFPERYAPIAECMDMMLFSQKQVARMLRLSKLDERIVGIDGLDSKSKVKLVMGIFGLFDFNDLPMLFCKFLEVYPGLKPYFQDTFYVNNVIDSDDSSALPSVYLEQIYMEIERFREFNYRVEVWQHVSTHPVFLRYAKFTARNAVIEQANEFKGLFLEANEAIDSIADLSINLDSLNSNSESIYEQRVKSIDLSGLSKELHSIVGHPYFLLLSNKDQQKAVLVERLKNLDPNDLDGALDISEKVRHLASGYGSAPSDLKDRVAALTLRLEDYFQRIAPHFGDVVGVSGFTEGPLLIEDQSQLKMTEVVSDAAQPELQEVAGDHPQLEGDGIAPDVIIEDKVHSDLLAEIERLERENAALEEDVAEKDHLIRNFRAKEHQYRIVDGSRSLAPVNEEDSISKIKIIDHVVQGVDTPERILNFFAEMYPGNVVIMPSALNSAKNSADFKNVGKLRNYIYLLVTEYLEQVNSGVSSFIAKKVIGSSLKSGESETVNNNNRLRSMREFDYNGELRHFSKHIAIGNKYGTANTIRVYFEVIDKKIVISHCGEHLPVAMTS
jgi:hypothetical protein